MPPDPVLGDALARVILRMTSALDPTEVLRAVVAGLEGELDAALVRKRREALPLLRSPS